MKLSALILSALLAAGTASASEWVLGNLETDVAADNPSAGLYVLAESETGPALMLGCSERLGVQANVFLDGMTADRVEKAELKRLKSRQVNLITPSTEPQKFPWVYVAKQNRLVSVRAWQGKRIFNAAIRNEPVTLDVTKIGDVVLNLPPVNAAFENFSKTCAATAG